MTHMLYVIIAAFEGPLPLHDDLTVADMLFELANWHALAKLCLHTDVTLKILHASTQHMYQAVHQFTSTTCTQTQTFKCASEITVQMCCEKNNGQERNSGNRKTKVFNVINTFKYHSLGDYVDYIEHSGPTDNYMTQVVSLC